MVCPTLLQNPPSETRHNGNKEREEATVENKFVSCLCECCTFCCCCCSCRSRCADTESQQTCTPCMYWKSERNGKKKKFNGKQNKKRIPIHVYGTCGWLEQPQIHPKQGYGTQPGHEREHEYERNKMATKNRQRLCNTTGVTQDEHTNTTQR